jgi:hypothetical protein
VEGYGRQKIPGNVTCWPEKNPQRFQRREAASDGEEESENSTNELLSLKIKDFPQRSK